MLITLSSYRLRDILQRETFDLDLAELVILAELVYAKIAKVGLEKILLLELIELT